MPTLTRTLSQLRQEISRVLGDLVTATASGGSTTTLTTTNSEIVSKPADYYNGAELSHIITASGVVQTITVFDFAVSAGVATFTLPTSTTWTAPISTDTFEVHHISGRGFSKAQYDDAIFRAVESLADREWSDTESIMLACERGISNGATTFTGFYERRDYPLPAGLQGIYSVELLELPPVQYHGTGNIRTERRLGDATARSKVGQGFKLQQDSLVEFIAVWMRKVGSPTDNLTVELLQDASGVPSSTGTALWTNNLGSGHFVAADSLSDVVDGSTLQERGRYQVFRFTPPVLVVKDTQAHFAIYRSAAVSSSNFWMLGEDDGNNYSYGAMSLCDSIASATGTWTAVSGSDLIFAISAASTRWNKLAKQLWQYQPQTTDQLRLNLLAAEGTPILIKGGAPIARPTSETGTVPVRPEYVLSFAVAYLERGMAGRQSTDNGAVGSDAWMRSMGIQPPAARRPPANWTRISA